MKFTHISKKQVFKNDVITVFEEKLELPNNNNFRRIIII